MNKEKRKGNGDLKKRSWRELERNKKDKKVNCSL